MTKQISNNKKIIFKNWNLHLGACLVFGIWSLVIAVKAVKALTVTVIPPRLEVEVKPGQVITKTLKVKNETKEDLYLKVAAYDFIVNDDAGTPIIIEEELDNRWAASSWIQLPHRDLAMPLFSILLITLKPSTKPALWSIPVPVLWST